MIKARTIMTEFDNGPSHRDWVNEIPVTVIMDRQVGLKGALHVATTPDWMKREQYKKAA